VSISHNKYKTITYKKQLSKKRKSLHHISVMQAFYAPVGVITNRKNVFLHNAGDKTSKGRNYRLTLLQAYNVANNPVSSILKSKIRGQSLSQMDQYYLRGCPFEKALSHLQYIVLR
jgi:hypothetical protein